MATKNIVPRANAEGKIGTALKQWQEVNAQSIKQNGQAVANLASPALTGTPTAPTQSSSDDSTKLATTAFVHALITDLLSNNDIFIRNISTSETEWLSNAEYSGGHLSLAAGYCWRLLFSSGNVKFQYYNASGAGEGISWTDVNFQTSSLELLGTSVLTISEAAGKTQFRSELGLGTSALLDVPASGDAASGEVVKGNDTRLTDSRTCDNTFDNASTARSNLGLIIGTDVQAYDVILAYLSALTAASGKMIYFDSNTSVALTDITSHGRDLVGSANAAATRSLLSIATGIASGNYLIVDASSGAPNSGEFAKFTATGIEGRTLAEVKSDLSLAIGSDIQAWDAVLDYLSTITPATDKIPYFDSATSAAIADFTATGRTVVGAASMSALRTSIDVSQAGFTKAERTVTTSDSITASDETILANAASGLINLSVLTAASIDGRRVTVKKIDSSANTVTLTCAGAETIDGSSTYVLDTEDDAVTIESDGSNWHIVSNYAPGDTLISGVVASGTTAGSLRASTEPTDSVAATSDRGEGAVDWQQQRDAGTKVASGDFATLGGGLNNTASGLQSTVGGGIANDATGTNATVAGGGNNDATGTNATIGGGTQNTSTDTGATVGGGESNDATGTYATVAGGRNATASGSDSTVGGGSSNTTSATGATVSGGASNDASDVYSAIGGGANNEASADYATVAGGSLCTATANYASNLGGESNVSSGEKSSTLGGSNNTASAAHSVASGARALADQTGMRAHANGFFAAQGDAQAFDVVMRNITTDATPTELFLDGSATRLAVASGAILAGTIDILAVRTDGSSAGHWHKRFSIKNVAGTTSLVGSDDDISSEDPATASVSLTSDDSNDALAVNITGVSGQVWWWMARVNGVMIKFA